MAFRVGVHLASQKCDDKRVDEMMKSSQSREENNNNNNKVPLWLKGNVRRKPDKGIVCADDYDPSVSPNGLPAPFTQREPNVPAHALSIHSKSPLFYALIATGILFVLAIITISIKLSFSNATGEAEGEDTGTATLNSVSILQAGTGQSVTIKGETLNENDYDTDNTTRRTILNNNVVRYSANYNVTTTGQITFSITLPANNTIDEATIAESQYCLPNLSKLEPADITNDDGTITKSYTNNKATCVRNITTIGSTSWQITAYLWGANNTKIQPTLAVSGQTSTVRPEEISVVGKPNYEIIVNNNGYSGVSVAGYNLAAAPDFALFTPLSDTKVLGISPIEGFTFTIDTSQLPSGWYTYRCRDGANSASFEIGQTINTGRATILCQVNDEATAMTVSVTNLVTAVRDYEENKYGYNYFDGGIVFAVPATSLVPPLTVTFVLQAGIGMEDGATCDIMQHNNSVKYVLSGVDSGSVVGYVLALVPPGWRNDHLTISGPLYAGESMPFSPYVTSTTYSSQYASNLSYCITWNPLDYDIVEYNPTAWLTKQTAEYGVIGDDMSVRPSSFECGAGRGGVFFDELNTAKDYAQANSLKVNALRINVSELTNIVNGVPGNVQFVVANNDGQQRHAALELFARTDQWQSNVYTSFSPILTPGLLSHTLTAIPSSTNPGKEDHITITTKTYNKDTNSKITINLPNGLTPKEGSFTITTGYTHNDATNTNEPIKAVLIEGENQDYTITANGSSSAGNVGYTITLDLDHIASTHHVPITGYDPIYPGESGVTNITLNSNTGLYEEVITTNNNNEDSDINNDDLPIAADNNGNGISHIGTPIEFDVTVNEDTPSPSTLTINSTTSGTGTDYASTTFKTASDTITVANPPAMFGYDLVASSNNIYAGDNLTYDYSISNTTSSNTNDITMITVLPFNGDSRGTTGLKNLEEETNPYTISHLSLSLPSDGASGLDTSATKLCYTLDPKVHELEPNPEALALDSSITWQELELASDGNIPDSIMTNLQDQGILDSITALKLTTTTLPSSSSLKLNVTLDNILATTPGSEATLANDITYLSYASETNQAVEQVAEQTVEGTTNTNTDTATNTTTKTILRREGNTTTYSNGQIASVHQNPVKVAYLGELLALNIPEHEQAIQVTLGLNDAVIGNPSISDDNTNPVNHLNLVTATLRGYNLTIQTDTENGALVAEGNTESTEDSNNTESNNNIGNTASNNNAEGNTLRLIPAISTKPTTGTAGWSAKIAGSNNPDLTTTAATTATTAEDTWIAIPGTNQTPLNLYTSTAKGRDNIDLTVTYGISAAGTIADTYSTKVVYTVVAEP